MFLRNPSFNRSFLFLADGSNKSGLNSDDEAFLRAILMSQMKLPPLEAAGGSDQNDAAVLAAFLKSQGIEPSTPESLAVSISLLIS